jgi:6-phosphogluconate dehydrogenase
MEKRFGLLGLGKMGGNMARRMAEQGWHVAAWNRTTQVALDLEKENPSIHAMETFADVIEALPAPRVIWLMLPAGEATEEALFSEGGLAERLQKGDTIIDGGNSFWKDADPRAERLAAMGVNYLDCGTSGGPAGARNGACLMIGGQKETFDRIEELFKDFARPDGYRFFDGHGAGHFVKMVHNGIEYGMMQALAEGFAVMKKSAFDLDLKRVTEIYNAGSVIESRLVGWMKSGYEAHGVELEGIKGTVSHTGEGKWTVETAQEMEIEVPIIKGSYDFRVASEQNPSYTGQVLSMLRGQFGGHATK